MPRHLAITSGPLVWDDNTPSTLHNYHMQCGDNFCNDVVVTLQNVHNSNLRFSNVTFSPPATTTTITLVAVNGAPPSFTYLLAPGASLTITLRICTMVNSQPVEEWKMYLYTIEHGQDPGYYLPLEFVDPFTLIAPSPIDFGLVPFPGTGSVLTTVNNVCYHDIEFNGDVGLCEGHDITFSPNGITIPALMSAGVTVNWTPMSIGEFLQCYIYAGFCSGKPDIRYELLGTAIQDCSCLCCNDVTIGDENGYLRDQNGFCGNTKVFKAAAIVEKKFVKFNFTYNTGLTDGVELFFNPWLFSNQCNFSSKYPNGIITQPPAGYFIEFNEFSTPVGGTYPMQMFGMGSNELVNKNWEVYFEPIDAATGEFQILFQFFMIEDLANWMQNAYIANIPKWRRGSVNDINPAIGTTAPFPMASSSVYNATKKLASLFYLVDPNTIVDGQPFECFEENCINFQARFYNKGLLGAASELINWSIKFERNGAMVSNFSTLFKTKIIFQVEVPPAYSSNLVGAIFQVFDESQVENLGVDFLTNYNSSRAAITNIGGVSVLDNLLETPSTIVPLGGGVWEVTAYVSTAVVPGNVYRVAVVAYADDTQTVNTFLSEPLTVTQTPEIGCDYCPITVSSEFEQFFQSNETECLQPTAKERIRHTTVIENGDFKDCLDEWGYMSDWRQLLKTITVNVYRVEADFPNPGQSTFFMFETHTSNRVAGFPGGWQNLGALTVTDNGSALIDTDFTTRVGFETTPFPGANVLVANTATFMQRTPVGVLGSTYVSTLGITKDWRDGDVWVEYVYTFDLGAVFGVPFELNQVKGFMVAAIENEPDNSGFSSVLNNARVFALNALSGIWEEIEGRAICAQDYTLVRVVYSSNQNGDFSFYVTKNPETMAGLAENNPVAGPLGLPQLSQTALSYMDADFSAGNEAAVEFSINAWTNGLYNLCGLISIPPAVFICEYFQNIVCQGGSSLGCGVVGGGLFNIIGTNSSNGRYRNVTISDPVMGTPVQGGQYVLEYNLISGAPPTKEIHFWAGKDGGFFVAGTRPADGFIPIGATSGSIPFTWGGSVTSYIYFQLKANANPNWTGTMQIKIGNAACP